MMRLHQTDYALQKDETCTKAARISCMAVIWYFVAIHVLRPNFPHGIRRYIFGSIRVMMV